MSSRFFGKLRQLLQRDRVDYVQGADGSSPQGCQVGKATQRMGKILGQRADVGSFAAGDPQTTAITGKIEQLQVMDGHFARRALDFDSLPGEVVEGLPVSLECRVHRRNLSNRAAKVGHGGLEFAVPEVHRTTPDDAAVGVAGVGLDTEQQVGFCLLYTSRCV